MRWHPVQPPECPGCGSRYERRGEVVIALPSSLGVEAIHEEAYWGTQAPNVEPHWRASRGHLVRPLASLFVDYYRPHGEVLEIGAGRCWASGLVKREAPAAHVTATDVSPSALQQAELVWRGIGGRADWLVACDFDHLPFDDASFDYVVGVAALHHAPDLCSTLRELQRVLRPGGHYFGLDELATNRLFRLWWQHAPWSPFARRGGGLGIHERVHTLAEWQQAFREAGFRGVHLEFNRDWRAKRAGNWRRRYFQGTRFLPDTLFGLLPGASLVLRAER